MCMLDSYFPPLTNIRKIILSDNQVSQMNTFDLFQRIAISGNAAL